ncbi:MAG: helix-turn-helix transcriptional regulator, partial [Candidatus Paceibacterota bacterium]
MVRIGVYRGHEKDEKTGLTLLNFDVLNELEETKNTIKSFQLVSRFNEWKEPMMENRIYFVNIIPTEKNKPVSEFEILDKSKFITHEDGKYLISYRKYSGVDLIEFYEKGAKENKKHDLSYNDTTFNTCQEYIEYCLSQKKGERLHFNTFTKYILERIFENYGYDNVIHYRTKKELKMWSDKITQKVKNFAKKNDTKFTDWSNTELEYLIDNMDTKTEKEIAKHLNRTVPSIATKKWKIRNESTSKLKEMKTRAESISEFVKAFRKEKDYNQKAMAKASGVSVSVISQLECGKYIGTDTPIVDDLLKYIDKESTKLNFGDIP